MDYCTLWFEGWWAYCCAQHDLDYINQVARAAADASLSACVLASAPNGWWAVGAVVAATMYGGVRLFGWYFYKRAV